MGEEKQSFTKNLLLVVGFVATIAAIAGAVYAVIKYFEDKKTEEFMDYYFDEDEYIDDEDSYEEIEEVQSEEE